jgi:LysR family glycine cleavage system transcriptional activator
MIPVCSPNLLGENPLNEPRDLARHTLLHVIGALDDWPLWLAAAQAPEVLADRGPRFDSYALAMEAAAHRCGVAMGRCAFVQGDLREGRLVAPFTLRVGRSEAWHLLWPKTRSSGKVSLFRSWLLARAQETRDSIAVES